MFTQWFHYSIVLLIVGVLGGLLMGGLEAILPLVTLGGVIYVLFHVADGLNG